MISLMITNDTIIAWNKANAAFDEACLDYRKVAANQTEKDKFDRGAGTVIYSKAYEKYAAACNAYHKAHSIYKLARDIHS